MTLTITVNPDRTASVEGPIGDLLVAYGMLEVGKDLVRSHHAKERAAAEAIEGEQIITAASAAALIDLARQRGGG